MRAMGLRGNVHCNPEFDMLERAFQGTKIRERISVFKPTQEDWHPAWQLTSWWRGKRGQRLVEVSFLELLDGEWRVCVWGADDHGLEFDSEDRVIIWALFKAILHLPYVTHEWLTTQGFVHV